MYNPENSHVKQNELTHKGYS